MHSSRGLSFWQKLIYGSGDWSLSSFNTLRQVFYAIFLTDVVGLEPRLASVAALIGVIWDAFNDPLIGKLTDRVSTRWGRRRPFLLFFSIPFGLSFVALWWAPPLENQYLLATLIFVMYALSDTLQTLVSIPFYSLIPEIAPNYDERTNLTGFRMFFNLIASLATTVAAPEIVDAALRSGATQQQGYLLVAALFGGMAVVPFLLIVAVIRENSERIAACHDDENLLDNLKSIWRNIPFRYAALLYMLNWIAFDLVGLVMPFFLAYWVAQGDLLAKALGLSLESAIFGCLLIMSVFCLPAWVWLARRLGKRQAYVIGMLFWAVVQLLIYTIQPGQLAYCLVLATLAGIGVSTAHVLPDAIYPDVIEWDELHSGKRREGMYYGVKNFLRKLTGALAIFIALQILGWFGYQNPPEGITQFRQPDAALAAIRFLIGPLGALLLFGAIGIAWLYPLTREKYARVQSLLERRKQRSR